MTDTEYNNGWDQWKNLVLTELKTLSTEMKEIREDQIKIREDLAGLKIKSGVWGLIGGAILPIVVLLIWLIKTSI